MRCTHCLQEDHGLSHFTSGNAAEKLGTRLCGRAGQRVARGQYWGWACAPDHTCHAGRLPPVPDQDPAE